MSRFNTLYRGSAGDAADIFDNDDTPPDSTSPSEFRAALTNALRRIEALQRRFDNLERQLMKLERQ